MKGHQRGQEEMDIQPHAPMPQQRPDDSLEINQAGRYKAEPPYPKSVRELDPRGCPNPFCGSQKSQTDDKSEKGLGQTGMEDRQRLLEQDDPKAAYNPLGDDQS